MKQRIAVITGGAAAELSISLKSAEVVFETLDRSRFDPVLVTIKDGQWLWAGGQVDLNDLSIVVAGQQVFFDAAFVIIHGHPAEDGHLQGFLKMHQLPHTVCDLACAAVTFSKSLCKAALEGIVPMARSVLMRAGLNTPMDHLNLPLFVKPNKNGSSYGISKVKTWDALPAALELAFQYDDEVLVEEFLEGREFGNGVFRQHGEVQALPITEIITENEFFDYEAKYEGKSQEITPADLSEAQSADCMAMSRRIYEALDCKGVVRMDYILTAKGFHLLEVNTIPGLSKESIIPQQVAAAGMSLSDFFSLLIDEALATPSR